MGFNCFSSLQVCRLRVALLDDAGAPDPDAEGLWVTDALIQIGWRVRVREGSNFRQPNGCGTVCLTYQGPDQIEGVDLTLQLCTLDHEGIALMTQSNLAVVDGVTRGFALPSVNDDLDRRVSVEAWAKAWDGDEQAVDSGNALYQRYIWPSTSWVFGDGTLEDNPLAVPLSGRGRSNSQFGNGPGNDLPWGVYTSAMGIYTDDGELPDAICGTATLVAS